jgi:predicted small lipoprotein YifL
MKKILSGVIAILVMTALFAGISGCKKEGPLERAGKSIDKAVEKSGDQIEKVGKKIEGDNKGK